LHLTHLEVLGFRNVSRADVDLSSGINLLVGENGAGKTAILEAIYLLARGRSFRTTQSKQLIRHGDDELVVRAEVDTGQMVHRLARGKSRGGETKAKIDGESAHKQSRFAELLPLQTLLPGIADLVLDGPSIRREFVDWGLFHVEHQYLEISRRYRKALGQRSAWLREGHDGTFDKDPWAQDIAKQGALINHRRKGFVASLDQQTRRIFAALGAELEVQLIYHGAGDTEDAAAAMVQLAESYERDLRHGTTHIGPHRNDVDIAVNGTNAKNTVSRGQAKLIASAIVLAYCTELSQQSNVLPVLLLDDFGAELDSGHRERFFLELERIGCQVIATTIDEPKYLVGDALASRARVFHVEQGAISRYS
jgi:DNA replication and repair protein RecF